MDKKQTAAEVTDIPEALRRTAPVASAPVTPAPTNTATKTKAAKPAKAKAAKAAKPAKDEGKAKNPRSIVPVRFKAAYKDHNDTCGSKLALALKTATTVKNSDGRDSLDVKALFGIAKANGVDVSKYTDLNNGQKRMNVGNKLAGLLKAGETVTIGKQKFANAEKALAPSAHAEQAAA